MHEPKSDTIKTSACTDIATKKTNPETEKLSPVHIKKPEVQMPTLHPAQLFLGPHELLIEKTVNFLQKHLCAQSGCQTCHACTAIAAQQHHAVTWLTPEKTYTLDELEPIFSTIIFALAPEQHHFFVIQKADFLSTVCANKLLKSLEEPPTGYHFILLAQREHALLTTIRSRCIQTTHAGACTSGEQEHLFSLFTSTQASDPGAFLKLIGQTIISERESIELLDKLLAFWFKKNSTLYMQPNNAEKARAEEILSILKKAAKKPPMPGSSKLFWKNLYLQIKQ